MLTLLALIRRDLMIARRTMLNNAQALILLAICLTFFALVSPSLTPAIFWTLTLITATLAFGTAFHEDFTSGALDLLVLAGSHPILIVCAKISVATLGSLIPLTIIAPLVLLPTPWPASKLPVLFLALLLALPTLALLAGLTALIGLGARNAATVHAVITLPLATPILLFAHAAVTSPPHLGQNPALFLLAAELCLMLALTLVLAAPLLRQALASR